MNYPDVLKEPRQAEQANSYIASHFFAWGADPLHAERGLYAELWARQAAERELEEAAPRGLG